jgi:hypothetical protein
MVITGSPPGTEKTPRSRVWGLKPNRRHSHIEEESTIATIGGNIDEPSAGSIDRSDQPSPVSLLGSVGGQRRFPALILGIIHCANGLSLWQRRGMGTFDRLYSFRPESFQSLRGARARPAHFKYDGLMLTWMAQ